LVISPFAVAAQKPTKPAEPVDANSNSAIGKLPKIWHIDGKHKDFRVEVTNDLFRAEWVNLPPAAAKQGAYIHTECRRAGTRWVGSSSVYQGIAVPGAPAGQDIKMCHLTVRFEVDSITPQKIVFHSEAMRNFDAATCQLLKTAWEEFTWIPKK
jgi:hypothetical protein